MKRLKRIRLINWHYVANETIYLDGNVLLTGPNASGKSSIMDAITFVITGGDTVFNLSANEKGKRDLRGYIKCKLGLDDKEYLREGDVTGHIALEFYDDKLATSFVVGAIVDCPSDLASPKTIFYSTEGTFQEEWFSDVDNKILTTVTFRKQNPSFTYYINKKEAKSAFKRIFGSLNNDFFSLVHKGLAFRPISDVKEFIYQNVLEAKQIDVTLIQDVIRSYKDLELTLNNIKHKITDLKELDSLNDELEAIISRQDYNDYLNKLIYLEQQREKAEKLNNNITVLAKQIDSLNNDLSSLTEEKDNLSLRATEIYSKLINDEDFKTSESLERDLKSVDSSLNSALAKKDQNLAFLTKFKEVVQDLRKIDDKDFLKKLANLSFYNLSDQDLINLKATLESLKLTINTFKNEAFKKLGALEREKRDIVKEVEECRNNLKELSKEKVNFPSNLVALRNELESNLANLYGFQIPIFILAELIEITDPAWQETVEMFLSSRRFNLIVEPKYYDQALEIYARISKKYALYNSGLVNTKKIVTFKDHDPNSLATIISSNNKDAIHFINMICGKVIMCADNSELENYQTAITNSGLLYSGFTVRRLNPNILKPLCGKNAFLSQRKIEEERAANLARDYKSIEEHINNATKEGSLYNALDVDGALAAVDNLFTIEALKLKLKGLNLKKAELASATKSDIRSLYDNVNLEIASNDQKIRNLAEEIGKAKQGINENNDKLNAINHDITICNEELTTLAKDDLTIKDRAMAEFSRLLASPSFKEEVEKMRLDYDSNASIIHNLEQSIVKKQYDYITNYESSFGTGLNCINAYLKELARLEKTELVNYEQKVRDAREKTELIFKEDFIAKLKANIESAELEMKKINDTLSKIRFGNDSYKFVFPKSSEYGMFYDMVTSDAAGFNKGIFTDVFEAKYEEQIKELFDSLAVDELNSNGAFNKFTDYRTYLDYDIKITNQNGESMSYSKVFKEKSGGETQVPFYVAMIASFVRCYTANGSDSNSIGLVLFDEVFDKMDSERMKAVMEFINSMPLQMIIACPPEKLPLLKDFTDTVLIVARQGKRSMVVDYKEDKVS